MLQKTPSKKIVRKSHSLVKARSRDIRRSNVVSTNLLLRRVMMRRKNKPIKVMFVCVHGLSTSVISKEWFIDFLEHKGMRKYFKFSVNDENFSTTNKSNSNVDYIVPIFPRITPNSLDFITPSQKKLLMSINSGKSIVLSKNPLQYLSGKGTLQETQSRFLRQILIMEQKRRTK